MFCAGVGAIVEDVDRFDDVDVDAFICRIFIFDDCITNNRRKRTQINNYIR